LAREVPTAQFDGADARAAGTRDAIAEAARDAVEPTADLAGTVEYKRHLVGVFAQRAIDSLLAQAS
jgi:CO/xanthine dehydrogenase FAD-binding subunit